MLPFGDPRILVSRSQDLTREASWALDTGYMLQACLAATLENNGNVWEVSVYILPVSGAASHTRHGCERRAY